MNILICDDDINYALKCKGRVERLAEKQNIDISVEIVTSGKQLLFFKDTKYAKLDLIYIDQNMPELTGIETAKELRKSGITADIVFYTIDDSKAIDAYDVEALHYIVKGKTTDEKFNEIFIKAAERAKNRNVEVMAISCAGEHRNIRIEDILYFSVQARIVTVHYNEGKKVESFDFYSSLSKIEEFLFGKGFVRIHGSYLVAKRFIRKKNAQYVEMINGDMLPIGRTYVSNIKK